MNYVLHFGPEALHVDMEGSFTFQDSHAFQKLMRVIKGSGMREEIRLNVTKLVSIDSTAIRLFMLAHDSAKKLHINLIFEGAAGSVLVGLTEAARYNMLNIAA